MRSPVVDALLELLTAQQGFKVIVVRVIDARVYLLAVGIIANTVHEKEAPILAALGSIVL